MEYKEFYEKMNNAIHGQIAIYLSSNDLDRILRIIWDKYEVAISAQASLDVDNETELDVPSNVKPEEKKQNKEGNWLEQVEAGIKKMKLPAFKIEQDPWEQEKPFSDKKQDNKPVEESLQGFLVRKKKEASLKAKRNNTWSQYLKR